MLLFSKNISRSGRRFAFGGNQGVSSVGTGETTSSKLENEAATLITAALVRLTVLGPHLARVGSAAVEPTGDAAVARRKE